MALHDSHPSAGGTATEPAFDDQELKRMPPIVALKIDRKVHEGLPANAMSARQSWAVSACSGHSSVNF